MSRKIVIIGTAYPFKGGGMTTFNERLAIEFVRHGDDVTIHTFSLQYPSFLFPGKSQYADRQPPDGLKIEITINSVNPINWFCTGKKISRCSPDIVVIRYWLPFMAPCLGTIARRIKKNRHTAVIAIVDNMLPHEKRPGDRMLSRYFAKSVDGFICMSQSVMDELRQFDEKKPKRLCPHPLYDNFGEPVSRDKALAHLQLPSHHRYLLFFGLIRQYKGLDLLLEAMGDERVKEKNLRLIVAGEFYEDEEKYNNILRRHGIEDNIIFTRDHVPDDLVKYYFSAADVVVQPYRSATQSGVTQVAYQFDKPMIVTAVGALPEMIPHGKVGYVVAPEPKAIAGAICDIFEGELLEKFTGNIKEEKKRFTWGALVAAIEETACKRLI